MTYELGNHCVVACADAFRGDGAIFASGMGPVPRLATRLARATFEPDLVITDGVATIVDVEDRPEGWMPFSRVFDVLWRGRRHVMMGASQIDRHGAQNISAIGDHAKPKVQLLGVRGAPGNTINHTTSYWVGRHSSRIFVPEVDVVSGVGTKHAVELRRIVSNLGVFDLKGPDATLRLIALHPGKTVDDVVENTGFPVHVEDPGVSRAPTDDELDWLERLDPEGAVRSGIR